MSSSPISGPLLMRELNEFLESLSEVRLDGKASIAKKQELQLKANILYQKSLNYRPLSLSEASELLRIAILIQTSLMQRRERGVFIGFWRTGRTVRASSWLYSHIFDICATEPGDEHDHPRPGTIMASDSLLKQNLDRCLSEDETTSSQAKSELHTYLGRWIGTKGTAGIHALIRSLLALTDNPTLLAKYIELLGPVRTPVVRELLLIDSRKAISLLSHINQETRLHLIYEMGADVLQHLPLSTIETDLQEVSAEIPPCLFFDFDFACHMSKQLLDHHSAKGTSLVLQKLIEAEKTEPGFVETILDGRSPDGMRKAGWHLSRASLIGMISRSSLSSEDRGVLYKSINPGIVDRTTDRELGDGICFGKVTTLLGSYDKDSHAREREGRFLQAMHVYAQDNKQSYSLPQHLCEVQYTGKSVVGDFENLRALIDEIIGKVPSGQGEFRLGLHHEAGSKEYGHNIYFCTRDGLFSYCDPADGPPPPMVKFDTCEALVEALCENIQEKYEGTFSRVIIDAHIHRPRREVDWDRSIWKFDFIHEHIRIQFMKRLIREITLPDGSVKMKTVTRESGEVVEVRDLEGHYRWACAEHPIEVERLFKVFIKEALETLLSSPADKKRVSDLLLDGFGIDPEEAFNHPTDYCIPLRVSVERMMKIKRAEQEAIALAEAPPIERIEAG
jgi:hypothetical protein